MANKHSHGHAALGDGGGHIPPHSLDHYATATAGNKSGGGEGVNNSAFQKMVRTMVANIKVATPKDTGNLAYNATRYEFMGGGTARIFVNTVGDHVPESRDGIAPYFVKVNYDKNISFTNNRGQLIIKPNKNYHYWDDAIDKEVRKIADIVGGIVAKEGAPDA